MENPNFREVIEKDMLARGKETVPAGQEWQVKQLLKCEITVKAGAKLVVTEMAAKNKIMIEDGGEFLVTGENLNNEETRVPEQPQVTLEETKEAAPSEEEKQRMLFTLGIDEETIRNNIRYNAFMKSGDVKVLATDKVLEIMGKDPNEILASADEQTIRTYIKEVNFLTKLRKEIGLE